MEREGAARREAGLFWRWGLAVEARFAGPERPGERAWAANRRAAGKRTLPTE